MYSLNAMRYPKCAIQEKGFAEMISVHERVHVSIYEMKIDSLALKARSTRPLPTLLTSLRSMEEHVLAAVYPMLLLPPQLSWRVSGTAHGFLQRHRSLPPSARRRHWCNAHPHNNNNLLIYSPTNMQWEPGATIWSPFFVPRSSPTIRPAFLHSSLISIPQCVLLYLYSTTRTPNAKARRSSTETEFSNHCPSKTWWALCTVRTRFPQFDARFLSQNCWKMHLVGCASLNEKPLLDAQVASCTIPNEMMKLKSLYSQIHAVHFSLLHYWTNFLFQKSWRFLSLSILGPQVSGSASGLRSEYANPSSALASDLSVKKGFRSGLI